MGLGPIPYVLIPEVSPPYVSPIEQQKLIGKLIFIMQAVSSLASVALSLNCRHYILTAVAKSLANVELTGITNFFVGLIFLPLRNFLSDGDMLKEGRVFYIFVAALSLPALLLFKIYR